MRTIRYQRLVFDDDKEAKEVDLLHFIMTEGYLAQFINSDKRLPPLPILNRILGSGKGDDGFVLMRWDPFTITEQEYAELEAEYKKHRG